MLLPNTPLAALVRELRTEFRQHNTAGRRVIAVEARAGADAVTVADALAAAFEERGEAAVRASANAFSRGTGPDALDLDLLRRVLIGPFRMGVGAGFQLQAWDALRDEPVESRWLTAPADAVLIVDGAFLLTPEARGIWNFSVLCAEGDPADGDPGDGDAPGAGVWSDYVRRFRPADAASALVRLSDGSGPARVFNDHC